jgi:hypothetical protein
MKNKQIEIAILPTGEWAQIVHGEGVTYIYPDKKTFLALCKGAIDIDDATAIAEKETTLKQVLGGK